MDYVLIKRLTSPDEIRMFEKGTFEVVRLGGLTVGRASYEPGWKWSTHVGPLVGQSLCQSAPENEMDARADGERGHAATRAADPSTQEEAGSCLCVSCRLLCLREDDSPHNRHFSTGKGLPCQIFFTVPMISTNRS
jgi:hypothetical protein